MHTAQLRAWGCTCSGSRRQQSAQSTAHLWLGLVERTALLSSMGRQLVQGSNCKLFANVVAVYCSFGVFRLYTRAVRPKTARQARYGGPRTKFE